MAGKKYICTDCGEQRLPVWVNRGNRVFEVMLWLCYLLPGFIYSIWRRLGKRQVCPRCGASSMVPLASPKARAMLALMKPPGVEMQDILSGKYKFQDPAKTRKNTMKNKNQDLSGEKNKSRNTAAPHREKKDLEKLLKQAKRQGLSSRGQQSLIDFKMPDRNKLKEDGKD